MGYIIFCMSNHLNISYICMHFSFIILLFLDFINSFLDELAGTLNHLHRLNCIAETEVAWLAECATGDGKDAALCKSVDKDVFLDTFGDLGECIEGTLRILDLKTSLTETVAESLTASIVPIDVHLCIAGLSTGKLDDCRSIHEAEHTSPESARGHDELAATVLSTGTRINCNIAKTLTRNAKILAEGSDNDVVLVRSGKHVAVLGSGMAVDDLCIRLIRDDPDCLLVLLGGSLGDLSDGVDSLLAVDLAAGIIGAVDDDSTSLLADGSLQGLDVRLEIALRARKNAKSSTHILSIEGVLAEVRSKSNDLLTRSNNSVEEHVDGTSSTNAHAQALWRHRNVAVHLGNTLGICFDAGRITTVGSVCVKTSFLRLAEPLKSILELLRRFQSRIAKAEIKNILTTNLSGKLGTKLKHSTNRATTGAHVLAVFTYVLHSVLYLYN